MIRQRLGLPSGLATTAGQKLTLLLGLALIYGGGVVIALGSGASGREVQRYSAYRTVVHQLSLLGPGHWSVIARVAIAVAGLLLFPLLMRLAWAQRLVPYRARTEVTLKSDELGRVVVSPRAIERAAELAGAPVPGVRAIRARVGEGKLDVIVHSQASEQIPDALHDVQRRVCETLTRSGLPTTNVHVTVTRFTAPKTRELR